MRDTSLKRQKTIEWRICYLQMEDAGTDGRSVDGGEMGRKKNDGGEEEGGSF